MIHQYRCVYCTTILLCCQSQLSTGKEVSHMTKLEKLRDDLAKADLTLAHARKRRAMLSKKVKEEEQRELQAMMDTMGLSLEDVKARLVPQKGGDVQ
jgi:hypothetical protein